MAGTRAQDCRMKREALSHTKMKRLCRNMNVPLWQAVGLVESLLHLTARESPRGDIGKLADEDIALALDYREDPAQMMTSLAASGWLDLHPQHRYVVHGWSEHCEDGVNMRLARGREVFADGQTPKLGRLGGKEREAAEEFYKSCAQGSTPSARTDLSEPCAQTIDPCAQSPELCAQTSNPESVRTPSALPSPSPSPSPSPRPSLDQDQHPIDSPTLSAKTAESPRGDDGVCVSPGSEELWETLSAWRLAFPDGPTVSELEAITAELNGTPVKAFIAHLELIQTDSRYRKFKPGAGAPDEPGYKFGPGHGFFKSTARNFAKDYGKTNGCLHGKPDGGCPQCLPRAKFDVMTETLN
jgi:hypothetical protein